MAVSGCVFAEENKNNCLGPWRTVCGGQNHRPWMALADDGTLWVRPKSAAETLRAGGVPAPENLRAGSVPAPESPGACLACSESWQPVRFNENYAGYYEPCYFTALACTSKDFVVAGLGKNGLPYVYRSLYGGVWDQINLTGGNPVSGWVRASGRIQGILYDHVTDQLFLYCDNGQLVTLPDCPKCVRIRQVADQAIISGAVSQDHLALKLMDGTELKVGMGDVMQLRISYSYAKKRLSAGGVVVWLGQDMPEPELDKLTGALPERLSMENLRNWLGLQPKDMFIAFWCDFGTQADEAAACARRMGYTKAFSLGGARPALHVV